MSSDSDSNNGPFGGSNGSQEKIAETTLSVPEQTLSIKRLTETERMYIRRPREPDQMLVSHDVTTKFEIVDQNGDPIYYLVQSDACCSRTFCCSNRWFTLDVFDLDENLVGQFERPMGCVTCFCGCCAQQIKVNFPPRVLIGEVNQQWNLFGQPRYQTQNAGRDLIYILEGSNCCGVDKIKIFNGMKERIGKMKCQWDGLPENKFASQTCFGLVIDTKEKREKKMDLEHRHLLLASAFLMGHNYFDLNKKVTHEELIPLNSNQEKKLKKFLEIFTKKH